MLRETRPLSPEDRKKALEECTTVEDRNLEKAHQEWDDEILKLQRTGDQPNTSSPHRITLPLIAFGFPLPSTVDEKFERMKRRSCHPSGGSGISRVREVFELAGSTPTPPSARTTPSLASSMAPSPSSSSTIVSPSPTKGQRIGGSMIDFRTTTGKLYWFLATVRSEHCLL